MNLVGKPCTLRPFTTEGIKTPRGIDMKVIARAFHTAVEEELERAGLGVRLTGPDAPAEQLMVSGKFTRVRAGSRIQRYLAPFLPSAPAIIEVEGLVSMDGNPIAELGGLGKRGLGPLGGASVAMLGSAAEIAGVQLARQALEALVG